MKRFFLALIACVIIAMPSKIILDSIVTNPVSLLEWMGIFLSIFWAGMATSYFLRSKGGGEV